MNGQEGQIAYLLYKGKSAKFVGQEEVTPMANDTGERSATYRVMLERYRPGYRGAANLAQVARICQRWLARGTAVLGLFVFGGSFWLEFERDLGPAAAGAMLLAAIVLLGAVASVTLVPDRAWDNLIPWRRPSGRWAYATVTASLVAGALVWSLDGTPRGPLDGSTEETLLFHVGLMATGGFFIFGAILQFVATNIQSRLDGTVFNTPGLSDDEKLALVAEVRAGLIIAPSAAMAHGQVEPIGEEVSS